MVRKIAILAALTLALAGARAQTDNTVYVKQFPGRDLGTKLTSAITACPSATFTCIVIIDPSLAGFQTGTIPSIPSNVVIQDFRYQGKLFTAATLPTSPVPGTRVTITDGSTGCTGGGTSKTDCRWNGSSWDGIGGGTAVAGVSSFNARSGSVSPQPSDYSAALGSNSNPPTSHYNMPAPTLYYSNLTTSACNGGSSFVANGTVGIVSSSPPTLGTCTINLPTPIDQTKPFRIAVGMQDSDATNNISAKISNFTNGQSGVNVGVSSGNIFCNGNWGSSACITGSLLSVPNNTQFFLNVIGDGTSITVCMMPATLTTIEGSVAFNATWDGADHCGAFGVQYVNATYGAVWNNLQQITIVTGSSSSLVLSLYVSQGFIGAPTDGLMNPPGKMFVSSGLNYLSLTGNPGINANGNELYIPGNYGNPNGAPLLLHHHPNGYYNFLPAEEPTMAAFINAGFMVGSEESNQNACTSDTLCSNWGAPAGLVLRKVFVDAIRQQLPNTWQLAHFGSSMGLLNALDYEATYPGSAGIIGVSGVSGLQQSYNQSSPFFNFASTIETAYGSLYDAIQAGTNQNPTTATAYWTNIAASAAAPGQGFLYSPTFAWKGRWSNPTSYLPTQLVSIDRSDGSWPSALNRFDPYQNPARYKSVPILLSYCDPSVSPGDTTINIAQDTNLQTAIVAAGGSVTLTTSTNSGCGHLTADLFSSPSTFVNFLQPLVATNAAAQFGPSSQAAPAIPTFPSPNLAPTTYTLYSAPTNNATSAGSARTIVSFPIAALQPVAVKCHLIYQINNAGDHLNIAITGPSLTGSPNGAIAAHLVNEVSYTSGAPAYQAAIAASSTTYPTLVTSGSLGAAEHKLRVRAFL